MLGKVAHAAVRRAKADTAPRPLVSAADAHRPQVPSASQACQPSYLTNFADPVRDIPELPEHRDASHPLNHTPIDSHMPSASSLQTAGPPSAGQADAVCRLGGWVLVGWLHSLLGTMYTYNNVVYVILHVRYVV